WRAAWRTGPASVRADLHHPPLPLAPALLPDVAAGAGGAGAAAERPHPAADRAHAGRRLVAARQLVDFALRRCGPVAVPVPAARRPARTIKDARGESDLFRRRALAGFVLILLGLSGLVGRYVVLQVSRHAEFVTRS